jgi:hypothetical protein
MTMRLNGTCVLVLSVFVFAVPAYAGNGNGNGKDNGNSKGNAGASDVTPAPGNSANAPGQQKKDAAQPVETTTTAVATTTTTVAAPSAAPSEGVKPSNNTQHETHAQAQSKETKLYGNGQTAGQIAIKHGASGNTVLHGPGNSQPHKAAPCSGGHERDVHALKGRHAASCGGNTPTPQPTPTPTPSPGPPGHDDTPPAVVKTEDTKPTAVDPAPQPDSTSGEAPGAVASSSNDSGGAQGVLASGPQIGRVASLPFTGLGLWPALLAGMALIGAGLALRQIRTAEVAVGSGHDHTNRARDASGSSRPSVGGRPGR